MDTRQAPRDRQRTPKLQRVMRRRGRLVGGESAVHCLQATARHYTVIYNSKRYHTMEPKIEGLEIGCLLCLRLSLVNHSIPADRTADPYTALVSSNRLLYLEYHSFCMLSYSSTAQALCLSRRPRCITLTLCETFGQLAELWWCELALWKRA